MKTVTAVLALLIFSNVASAQSPDPSKWMCRNLADSGNFVYQGETIFGTQACRPIPQAAPATPTVATAPVAPAAPKQDAGVAPAATLVAVSTAPVAPQPAVTAQPAVETRPCLIVRQAEGHRFRNSMIAGALTGGIGFAAGAASGGAKYEYVDSLHFSNTKLKYDGKELQKLQESGVHIVTVSKKATGDEIKDARESCRE
ncbi:MAG: hypothetical protein ABSE45_07315 [Candidatus Acidiferrales bacterium]|jgi:hypothetical protein